MKTTTMAAILLSGLFSINANAEIIKGDLYGEGDSQVVLDTETGLEWLTLPLTRNHSINSASERFDGFRLATEAEVQEMFYQFLNEDQTAYTSNGKTDFMYHFGTTPLAGGTVSYGLVEQDDGDIVMYGARSANDYVFKAYESTLHNSRDKYNQYYSVFLVSDLGVSHSALNDSEYSAQLAGSPASVPTPFLFSGLTLLGLALGRKKIAS